MATVALTLTFPTEADFVKFREAYTAGEPLHSAAAAKAALLAQLRATVRAHYRTLAEEAIVPEEVNVE